MNHCYTSFKGTERYRKDDPRICLRGMLDSLCAEIVLCGAVLKRENILWPISELERLLQAVRSLQLAEAQDCDADALPYTEEELEQFHAKSHRPPSGHVFCTIEMGEPMAMLNILRTRARDCERAAVVALGEPRPKFINCLNRLSSIVYCLMCDLYEKQQGEG